MSFFRVLRDGLFLRSRAESEMEQELQFHLESRMIDLQMRGMSPREAKRRAHLEFGSMNGYKESIRAARGFRIFDELRTDARFTFRTLRSDVGFSISAIVSLALGIGVNLATFASLYFMVLHPFPYPDLDRIMAVATHMNAASERDPIAPGNYFYWKQHNHSFENLAAYHDWDVNLTGTGHPDHIHAALISPEFFQILGISPERGRTFSAEESAPGRDAAVVISHGFWRSHMAAVSDPIGETLSLDGRKYIVVGVMPDAFNFPLASELWAPLALTADQMSERRGQQLMVFGKLKPGVSQTQASADMDSVALRLEELYPQTNQGQRALVTPLREAAVMSTGSDHFLTVLMCAALFVLLLACTNVSSLQIARAMARKKEAGLRRALGASYFRIVRQLLTESLIIGLAGGVLGLVLAALDIKVILLHTPALVYRIAAGVREMRMSWEFAGFGLLLAIAVSLLCCVPAAIRVYSQTSADLNGALKDGARSSSASPARSRLRTALVVTEVALAFVLLVGAGLMVNTFQKMATVDVGFDSSNILTADISLANKQYDKPSKIVGFYEGVFQNVAAAQDGAAVTALSESSSPQPLSIMGRGPSRADEPMPEIDVTTSQYLSVMRIPLLKGRWISEQDSPDTSHVVVLSESIAQHYWPASNPIGEQIKVGSLNSPWLTVVGVIGDVHDWFSGDPVAAAYVSYRQFPHTSMQLLVRGVHDSRELTGSLRAAAAAIDREQPLYNIHTLEQQRNEEMWGFRNAVIMMGTYACIALFLAVTGIYSISSFFTRQRTHEIGVRMSLGATPRAILRMVMSQSCIMTGTGLLIGIPIAVLLTIGMSHVLFNVVAVEPIDFILFIVVLAGTSAVAAFIPAYRAAKIDPMIVLRHE